MEVVRCVLYFRCAVSELLGALIAATQAGETSNLNSKLKVGAQAGEKKEKQNI